MSLLTNTDRTGQYLIAFTPTRRRASV